MKGLLTDRATPKAGLLPGPVIPETAMLLAVRLLIIIALSVSLHDVPPPRHDPLVLILALSAVCHLVAVALWNRADDRKTHWLVATSLDLILTVILAFQTGSLPALIPTLLLLLAGLAITGPSWWASLIASGSIASLSTLIAVTGISDQGSLTLALALPGWLLLFIILSLKAREYQRLLAQIPAADALPGLSNRVTLDYAARFFIPYQQRNLAPMSLVVIRLIARERLDKPARVALHRLNEKRLAAIFEMRLRKCDVAARISTDTYALLLPDCDPDGAMVATREIQEQFAAWVLENRLYSSTVACISRFPTATTAMNHLAASLDNALDQVLRTVPSSDNRCFFASDAP